MICNKCYEHTQQLNYMRYYDNVDIEQVCNSCSDIHLGNPDPIAWTIINVEIRSL